ncbi:MAG: aminoacyl-tRNA hydrolase [Cyanobacteriota bacterium]|nr:aminoacyl-tRNA hydrolase [Cyanobacteriota bacterium]
MDLRLLVGLGNPGPRYAQTRHNVGFLVLERLAKDAGQTFRQLPRLHGQLAEVGAGSGRLRLLLPQTFMNESGRSVRATLDWFGLRPDQVLVVVDDMDLPLGRLRLRASGSAGGHNGLRSIIQHLGSEDFPRLRIGIGPPAGDPQDRKQRTVGHVLGAFSPDEIPVLDQVCAEVIRGIALIRERGLERAGNQLNSFRVPSEAS